MSSSYFASYRPYLAGESSPALEAIVRSATPADLPAVAKLLSDREGQAADAVLDRLKIQCGAANDRAQMLVADWKGAVVGYAKSFYFQPPPEAPANVTPEGWYLGGIVVAERVRRQGVGLALTKERLARLSAQADRVFYFVNAQNRPSIDLHAKLGFVEMTRDFYFPDVTFRGGVGILFQLAPLRKAEELKASPEPWRVLP